MGLPEIEAPKEEEIEQEFADFDEVPVEQPAQTKSKKRVKFTD